MKRQISPWKDGEFTAAIDKHVSTMPDRPSYVLAFFKFYRADGDLNFDALEPYKRNFLRTLPLTYFNLRVMTMLYGFEENDGEALMGILGRLSISVMDEACLYLKGVPLLHIVNVNE